MKPLALLTVLLCPGLGLAAERWQDHHAAVRLPWWPALPLGAARLGLALALAAAQLIHAAAWLLGAGRIHAAVAAGCWLLPLIFGVRSARAKGPASGPRGPIPRAPASP